MKPEFRRDFARLPYEEKIRKVGELIWLSRKVKLSTGKGVSIARVRENFRRWTKDPKKRFRAAGLSVTTRLLRHSQCEGGCRPHTVPRSPVASDWIG